LTVTNDVPAVVSPVVAVDPDALNSTSTYPILRGTSNVAKVGVLISRSATVDVEANFSIAVINGRWTYSTAVALVPGPYILTLFAGGKSTTTQLLISK
jgi:hypothetical protein